MLMILFSDMPFSYLFSRPGALHRVYSQVVHYFGDFVFRRFTLVLSSLVSTVCRVPPFYILVISLLASRSL